MNGYVADMESLGFVVDWRTLLIGLEGPGRAWPLIDVEDVELVAETKVATSSEDEALSVLSVIDEGLEAVRRILWNLSDKNALDEHVAMRKWMVVVVNRLLRHLPSDPLEAILSLMEISSEFDYPAYGPIPGKYLEYFTASERYSVASLRRMVEDHEQWLRSEINALRGR